MNTTTIIKRVKNRSLNKNQRKYICAWSKYIMEDSYGTEESFIWFNIYCALNKRTVDWFYRRKDATLECRKELMKRSANYLRLNKPNIP